MSSPRAAASDHAQYAAKRRKLRKGTHSCWECKRRKMRCIFDSITATTTCIGCWRRGSQCVSQEFPEEVSLSMPVDKNHKMGEGRTLFTTTPSEAEDGIRLDHGFPTPMSSTSEPPQHLTFYESFRHRAVENDIPQPATHTPASQGKLKRLSRFLHESLPSREDTERICKASRHPSVLAHEIMTMPYTTLDQTGLKTPESLLEIPGPNMHPVLIARHMLLLATYLQHLHPDLHKDMKGLSESPRAIMDRLADLSVRLVTTNDELLGSIEGLECVMIESVYQVNIGNLRRSWVAGRRAMTIAQLMGLHRSDSQAQYKLLDPKTEYHPRLMWFRIVFLDRYLCLLLGLSQGSLDRSMASDAVLANDTPMGRLERIHCVIASRILERNESAPSAHDLALTRALDTELQRAARSLPSKWWLAPSLDTISNDSQALFWNTRRLFAQVLHYNLLNQLHLPYMLPPSPSAGSSGGFQYYSLLTCANASREVLSRFITLRSFNGIAYSCRTVDFLALMAAMTLLLAHLDSSRHRSEAENLLAHQYHSDRAMIERVQENMEEVNRINSDALSAQSADLLRRLLTLDVEAAVGDLRGTRRVTVKEGGPEPAPPEQDDDAVVSVHIPYFGIIKIARDGMSKELPKQPATIATANYPGQSQVVGSSSISSIDVPHEEPRTRGSGLAERPGTSDIEYTTAAEAGYGCVKAQAQNDLFDPLLQQEGYPGLVAGGEDWAFQGVDMAFFESLMRSSGNEDSKWTTGPREDSPVGTRG